MCAYKRHCSERGERFTLCEKCGATLKWLLGGRGVDVCRHNYPPFMKTLMGGVLARSRCVCSAHVCNLARSLMTPLMEDCALGKVSMRSLTILRT